MGMRPASRGKGGLNKSIRRRALFSKAKDAGLCLLFVVGVSEAFKR